MRDEGSKDYIWRDQGCICNSLRSCATDQIQLRESTQTLIEGYEE